MNTTSRPARPEPTATDLLVALDQRLTTIASTILGTTVAVTATPGEAAGQILGDLAVRAAQSRTDDIRWLLLVGLLGEFPDADDLHDFRRRLELDAPESAVAAVLDRTIERAAPGGLAQPIRLVTGTMVEVGHTARDTIHTGIQRVVRETVPRWAAQHPLELVTWTQEHTAMRGLSAEESDRILNWSGHHHETPVRPTPPGASDELLVP